MNGQTILHYDILEQAPIATIHNIEEVKLAPAEAGNETRQEPGTLFIVMEYIKGRKLKEFL